MNNDQYLTFSVPDENGNPQVFGLEIQRVREILAYTDLYPIPMVSKIIRGILNLRGAAVPVMDLQWLFHNKAAAVSPLSCIVIFETSDHQPVGLLVNSVNEVINPDVSHREPAPRLTQELHTEFIREMLRVDDHFIAVLDIDKMLSDEHHAMLHSARNSGENLLTQSFSEGE